MQGERSRRRVCFGRRKPAREAAQCGRDFTARLIESFCIAPVRTQAADRNGEIVKLIGGVSHFLLSARALRPGASLERDLIVEPQLPA
jgi:hypothetical protein